MEACEMCNSEEEIFPYTANMGSIGIIQLPRMCRTCCLDVTVEIQEAVVLWTKKRKEEGGD